jgi:tripartite-type tricarboxylate transporter receptor subunit TctC
MKSVLGRSVLALFIGAGFIAAPLMAAAEAPPEYPSRPVRLIVPFPAGGGVSDVLARALADKLKDLWQQPVVVDNRPGAGGTLATGLMVKAPADGYTLMTGTLGTHVISPHVNIGVGYDAAKDVLGIAPLVNVPLVLIAGRGVPGTLADFVAAAKKAPGRYSYASPGTGTLNHLMGEQLKRKAGIDIVHVPYKAGAYPDLISGEVAILFDPITGSLGLVGSGKLKALAIASPRRSPLLPEVPTMAEAGFPGIDTPLWIGLFGQGQLPPAVVTRLQQDARKALAAPEVQARIAAAGAEVASPGTTPFATQVRQELKTWGAFVQEIGLKPE